VFPLRDLKPGQSFFVATKDPNSSRLLPAVKNARRLHNLNLITRTVTEGKAVGIRVWREQSK
jgi:hypothetical protein